MKNTKRPAYYTMVCVVAIAYTVIGFPSVFSPQVKKTGLLFPALSGTLIALEFVAEIGFWYMKQWGVRLYIMVALAGQCLHLYMDQWSVLATVINSLMLLIGMLNYRKMDHNL